MNKAQLLESLKMQGFSEEIIGAFGKIKREDFISREMKQYAYDNNALPLGQGATISQPYTIAFMLQLLELGESQKILEIGSGSGYVLALISEIIGHGEIFGIERIGSLAESSRILLRKNKNIIVLNRDGSNGLQEEAPFDRILISASADKMPSHLYPQLKDKGILVAVVKESIFQIKKQNSKIIIKEFPGFVFVPLVKTE